MQRSLLDREQDAMLFQEGRNRQRRFRSRKTSGGPSLDLTAESGWTGRQPWAEQAIDAGPIKPRLHRRARALGLVHQETPIPKHKPRAAARKVAPVDAVIAPARDRAIRNPEKQARIDFNKEWFNLDSDETPEGIKPDVNRDEYKPSSVTKSNSSV